MKLVGKVSPDRGHKNRRETLAECVRWFGRRQDRGDRTAVLQLNAWVIGMRLDHVAEALGNQRNMDWKLNSLGDGWRPVGVEAFGFGHAGRIRTGKSAEAVIPIPGGFV